LANGHGGKRSGAGRPKKPLVDKILEGTLKKHKAKVLDIPSLEDIPLPEPPEYTRHFNVTSIDNFVPNMETMYKNTVEWLRQTKCLHLINPDFIFEYAFMKTRWLECESIVSKVFLTRKEKVDKDGRAVPYSQDIIPNPMIDAAIKYNKAANDAWSKIWNIVAANSEVYFGDDPNKDVMAFLIKNKPEA